MVWIHSKLQIMTLQSACIRLWMHSRFCNMMDVEKSLVDFKIGKHLVPISSFWYVLAGREHQLYGCSAGRLSFPYRGWTSALDWGLLMSRQGYCPAAHLQAPSPMQEGPY